VYCRACKCCCGAVYSWKAECGIVVLTETLSGTKAKYSRQIVLERTQLEHGVVKKVEKMCMDGDMIQRIWILGMHEKTLRGHVHRQDSCLEERDFLSVPVT